MNKEQLLAAMESEVKEIEIKALGSVLRFKALTGKARDAFGASVTAGDKSNGHFEACLLVATVVDEAGNPMFDASEIDVLRGKDSATVSEMAVAAMKFNSMGGEAAKTKDQPVA